MRNLDIRDAQLQSPSLSDSTDVADTDRYRRATHGHLDRALLYRCPCAIIAEDVNLG